MTTNQRMAALHRKYGRHITIDYFFQDVWRVWVHGWHHHHARGIHGPFSGQGTSIDAAIDHLEDWARKSAPIQGDHCQRGCPHYTECD